MNAGQLGKGDLFVEISQQDWQNLSPARRKKLRRWKVEHQPAPCRTPGQVHVRVDGGNWCIHEETPVVLLTEAQVETTGKVA